MSISPRRAADPNQRVAASQHRPRHTPATRPNAAGFIKFPGKSEIWHIFPPLDPGFLFGIPAILAIFLGTAKRPNHKAGGRDYR